MHYCTIASSADAADLQHDFDAVQKWVAMWLMEFNPSKCQNMRISLKHKPVAADYR